MVNVYIVKLGPDQKRKSSTISIQLEKFSKKN
jgi:hypothetical protein